MKKQDKEQLEKRIAELQSELDNLKNELNQPEKEWFDELKRGDYFIDTVSYARGYSINKVGTLKFEPQYTFKTEQQAELLAKKCALMVEMHKFAELRNEGWVADWKDNDSNKFGIEKGKDIASADRRFTYNEFVFGIAVKSQTIAEEMLEIFGDRINEIYNTQL